MIRSKLTGFFILICVLVLFAKPLHSQFSYSIHYTVNDGLPSSKIYDMIQDSKGYIWFATENGVSRFNGYTFHNITTQEGLPTNSTIRLYEDYRGRIWFLSYQGSLSFFEDGQVHSLPFNPDLNKLNIPFFANIYVDKTETLWLSPFNGGLMKVGSNDQIEIIETRDDSSDSIYLYLDKRPDGYILAYVNPGLDFNKEPDEVIKVDDNEYYIHFAIDRAEHHFSYLEMPHAFLVSFGKKVYQVEGERVVERIKFVDEVIGVFGDQKNSIWISEKFNGVYQYQDDIFSEPANHFFPDQTISKVLQDNEGNYWFSTTENGVYFVPSLDINSYNKETFSNKNDIILAMDISQDDLFFSTDGKMLYHAIISGKELINFQPIDLAKNFIDNIYSILCFSENELYITAAYQGDSEDSLIRIEQGDFNIYSIEQGYNLKQLLNGDIALSQASGIKVLRGLQIFYDSPITFNIRVFTIEQAPDTSLWIGTIQGLYWLKNGRYEKLYSEDPVIGSRISTLKFHNNCLWVGSFDNGLAILSEDSTYYLNKGNGLSSNRVKSIFIENDSVAWIGTNRGLNRVVFSRNKCLYFTIDILDIWDGLPSNEINNIKKNRELLWLGTDKGLASFNPTYLEYRHKAPRLYLQRIYVDEMDNLSLEKPPVLKHNQNNITFEFNGVCFKNPRSTVYSYMLEGLNENWNETQNTSVRFHGLDPGNYTFFIQARNTTGVLSEMVKFSFVIRKHFTQTDIFVISIISVGLILIFLLVLYIFNSQKKRAGLQRQIYLAEQKAMLSQMNPHFIFNSLNSIQNFILDNDDKNANLYLVIFSSLIRKILEASQKNFISLKEELETIKLYLELEKFRFDKNFIFHIKVDPQINTDNVSIPSMVLQPYLENAIWHGIVPKNGKGILQLILAPAEQGGIIISIIDDGIGRKKALEISKRRKHHKPTGIKNVEERLTLLNALNKTNMKVKIIDLYDENSLACGTKVEFYLDD